MNVMELKHLYHSGFGIDLHPTLFSFANATSAPCVHVPSSRLSINASDDEKHDHDNAINRRSSN